MLERKSGKEICRYSSSAKLLKNHVCECYKPNLTKNYEVSLEMVGKTGQDKTSICEKTRNMGLHSNSTQTGTRGSPTYHKWFYCS